MAVPALDGLGKELNRTAVISPEFKSTISAWAHTAVSEAWKDGVAEGKLQAAKAERPQPPEGATHYIVTQPSQFSSEVFDYWVKDVQWGAGSFRCQMVPPEGWLYSEHQNHDFLPGDVDADRLIKFERVTA